MRMQKRIEHLLERTMYASRWIMAPIYLGMSLVLLALAVKFFSGAVSFSAAHPRTVGYRHHPEIADLYRLGPGRQPDRDRHV